MKDFTISEIANKYFEYKEILEKVENGDYNVPLTASQLEMARKIINQLDNMGFSLICKKIN